MDNRKLRLDDIIYQVIDYTGVTHEEMLNCTRKREVVKARHLSFYFGYYLTRTSTADIGAKVANKDHATVLHGAGKIAGELPTYFDTRHDVNSILDNMVKAGFNVPATYLEINHDGRCPREIITQ